MSRNAQCVNTTVARKPPSRMRRLLPRPTKNTGSPGASPRRNARKSARSTGMYARSTAPPARQLTCRAIGSFSLSSPRRPALIIGRLAITAATVSRLSSSLRHRSRAGQHARHAADRSRAHRQHHVAVARSCAYRRGKLRDRLHEYRLDLALNAHRARQRPAVGGDDRRLARRIDVAEEQRIRGREHLHEILEAVAGSRVAMRLEREHDAPPRKSAARGFQRRRHLRGVMAVIVDQEELPAIAEHNLAVLLEAATHTAEA